MRKKRDNRLWKPGCEGVQATFVLCGMCGEMYEAAYEHVCMKKNSYPTSVKGGKHGGLRSDQGGEQEKA